MESRRLLPPSRSPSQYPLFFSTPDLATDISEAAALPALDDPQHTGSDSAASSESGSTTPRRRASLSYDPSESGSTTASSTPTRAPSVTQGIPKPECLHQVCRTIHVACSQTTLHIISGLCAGARWDFRHEGGDQVAEGRVRCIEDVDGLLIASGRLFSTIPWHRSSPSTQTRLPPL